MQSLLVTRPTPLRGSSGLKTRVNVNLSARHGVVLRALTQSLDLEVGEAAPAFSLPDAISGKSISLTDISAGKKAIVVSFICNHCPFVVHLKEALPALAKEYQPLGVGFVAISSNSTETHPQDGPEKMKEFATSNGFSFPYLFDGTQEVAKAYRAVCTPEFFVFRVAKDGVARLAYHGQFDSSRPTKYHDRLNTKDGNVTGADLRAALDAALAGKEVPGPWKHSIGCNIKWTPGNEPQYYGVQGN